jgi:hypothetical protein
MNYEIYDHWASIKIINDGLEFLLPKKSIKSISLQGNDIIVINTGGCLSNIVFHFNDVSAPGETTPDGLVYFLNSWITESLLPPIGGG